MKKILAGFVVLVSTHFAFADETIIFIRHGEKPAEGLGQLTCQGLNRSLALPSVLLSKFDKPAAIYAPNPSILKNDRGVGYSYIRPLATIEPTAIRLGMPVNLQFGFEDYLGMTKELLQPKYKDATLFVSWEHHLGAKIARTIMKELTNKEDMVPHWSDNDFDSIYVIHIKQDGKKQNITFNIENQNLNGLSIDCNN